MEGVSDVGVLLVGAAVGISVTGEPDVGLCDVGELLVGIIVGICVIGATVGLKEGICVVGEPVLGVFVEGTVVGV